MRKLRITFESVKSRRFSVSRDKVITYYETPNIAPILYFDTFSYFSDGSLNYPNISCTSVDTIMGNFQTTHTEIYNMRNLHRDALYFTPCNITVEASDDFSGVMSIVHKGEVLAAYSQRRGSDIVTCIESLPLGASIIKAVTATNYVKDTPLNSVITDLATLLECQPIFSTTINTIKLTDNFVATGNVKELMDKLAKAYQFSYHIENNVQLVCVFDKDSLPSTDTLLTPSTGLISAEPLFASPLRVSLGARIRTMWNPELKVARRIFLKSSINTTLNRDYVPQIIKTSLSTFNNTWYSDLDCYTRMVRTE